MPDNELPPTPPSDSDLPPEGQPEYALPEGDGLDAHLRQIIAGKEEILASLRETLLHKEEIIKRQEADLREIWAAAEASNIAADQAADIIDAQTRAIGEQKPHRGLLRVITALSEGLATAGKPWAYREPVRLKVDPIDTKHLRSADGHILTFWYRNHKDDVSERHVIPTGLRYEAVPGYYPEPQWLLETFDLDKEAPRTFAVSRFIPDPNLYTHLPGAGLPEGDWALSVDYVRQQQLYTEFANVTPRQAHTLMGETDPMGFLAREGLLTGSAIPPEEIVRLDLFQTTNESVPFPDPTAPSVQVWPTRDTDVGLGGALNDVRAFLSKGQIFLPIAPPQQEPLSPEAAGCLMRATYDLRDTLGSLSACNSVAGREDLNGLIQILSEVHGLMQALSVGNVERYGVKLADIIYTLIGVGFRQGLPLDLVWKRVHAANMRKFPECSTCQGKGVLSEVPLVWTEATQIPTPMSWVAHSPREHLQCLTEGDYRLILADPDGKATLYVNNNPDVPCLSVDAAKAYAQDHYPLACRRCHCRGYLIQSSDRTGKILKPQGFEPARWPLWFGVAPSDQYEPPVEDNEHTAVCPICDGDPKNKHPADNTGGETCSACTNGRVSQAFRDEVLQMKAEATKIAENPPVMPDLGPTPNGVILQRALDYYGGQGWISDPRQAKVYPEKGAALAEMATWAGAEGVHILPAPPSQPEPAPGRPLVWITGDPTPCGKATLATTIREEWPELDVEVMGVGRTEASRAPALVVHITREDATKKDPNPPEERELLTGVPLRVFYNPWLDANRYPSFYQGLAFVIRAQATEGAVLPWTEEGL